MNSREKKRLFVDPASISTGWAFFVGNKFVASGTVRADKRNPVFERLADLWARYRTVSAQLDEVHLERLPRSRTCAIQTHWSVGVIGAALAKTGAEISEDIPPTAWQKAVGWKTVKAAAGQPRTYKLEAGSSLLPFVAKVESDDELSAVGLGLYWLAKNAA